METSRKIKYSRIDRLILGIAYALLGLFVLSIVIPLIYVVLASFMDPTVLNNQGLSFRIKDWTLDAYRRVLENEMIWRGFFNSSIENKWSKEQRIERRKLLICILVLDDTMHQTIHVHFQISIFAIYINHFLISIRAIIGI